MSRTGLLVIDLQEGFNPSALLIGLIEKIAPSYDAVVFTRFENTENSLFRKQLQWHGDGGKLCLPSQGHVVLEKRGYGLDTNHIKAIQSLGGSMWHLAGVETDACVMACAFSLFDGDIPFKIICEACESPIHEQAMPLLARQFGEMISISKTAY